MLSTGSHYAHGWCCKWRRQNIAPHHFGHHAAAANDAAREFVETDIADASKRKIMWDNGPAYDINVDDGRRRSDANASAIGIER
jgi:hypothetical protein